MKNRLRDVFWVAANADGTKQSTPHPHVVVQDDEFKHSPVSTVVVSASPVTAI